MAGSRRLVIHLVANAHLDPVWLWDWREGLNEGIATCRTMLDLMDEDPDFTFIRGEAAIYQHLAEHDQATLRRIRRRIAEGRWDVVGGTWIQPDHNLPSSETLIRQFTLGQRTLERLVGVRPRVAWAPDTFGHPAGLPDILAGAGIESFVFTRPEAHDLQLEQPAFWWQGCGGARVLAYRPPSGWYGCERNEVASRLDACLAQAQQQALRNVGFSYGLGNHGGGASRHHLADIRAWAAAHPEVTVVHSGWHRLLAAIRSEVRTRHLALPVRHGELNFIFRGCYSSVAKLKWPFRRLEDQVATCETLAALVATQAGRRPATLDTAWQGLCFNAFHDILPGSSIERAYDDQLAWLGGITHRCHETTLRVLNQLAARIDTRPSAVPADHPTALPFIVWNPHPRPWHGHVELEANLDYRPIWAYAGKPDQLPLEVRDADGAALPFQRLRPEHLFMPELPFRNRVLVPVTLPPLGWRVLTLGWVEQAAVPVPAAGGCSATAQRITNGQCAVTAEAGGDGIGIRLQGRPLGDGVLRVEVVDDVQGSWGDMRKNAEPLPITVRERWRVTLVQVLESGPERAALWVRLTGGASRIDLLCRLGRADDSLEITARLLWNERSARLRLVLGGAQSLLCQVPGGQSGRTVEGEVPTLRWVRVLAPDGGFGFASDGVASVAVADGDFHATLVRATRYAADGDAAAGDAPWNPAVDCGELRCRLLLTTATCDLPRRAAEFVRPPLVQTIPARAASGTSPLARSGSCAALAPEGLELIACKPADDGDGLVVRVHEMRGRACTATLTWFAQRLRLGRVGALAIASWRLRLVRGKWLASRCDHCERPLATPRRRARVARTRR